MEKYIDIDVNGHDDGYNKNMSKIRMNINNQEISSLC